MGRVLHDGKGAIVLASCVVALLALCACAPSRSSLFQISQHNDWGIDTSGYLIDVENEPDTVDFQCTSLYYIVADNVFDRLVTTEKGADGETRIAPSLAESWVVSDDGTRYTFRLREGVTFSNGSALTASDVLYTFTRLLTHPNARNQDIVEGIKGAGELERGEADKLAGFDILDDLTFTITLEQPFEAFLACLSMSGASIMDEQTTEEVGDRFGTDPDAMVGTGPFIFKQWNHGEGMLFEANEACWAGAPRCAGIDIRFERDAENVQMMFEEGKLDILDLDEVPDYADYYIHGDIYQDKLLEVQRVGICYIALNESVPPLNDVRVRKALQLSLDRETLLDVVYGSRGEVENGIFPHGLYGYNADLAAIPFDQEQARTLLSEAGYPNGFDLDVSVRSSSTQQNMTLLRLAAEMWGEVGIRASIRVMSEDEFMSRRNNGELACYTATWTADYDDPDNFIYAFFGDDERTRSRSLCYGDKGVMARVRAARSITDPVERIREYQGLEKKIVQDDAAWIPLFSRNRQYVMSDRAVGNPAAWNGLMTRYYCNVAILGDT